MKKVLLFFVALFTVTIMSADPGGGVTIPLNPITTPDNGSHPRSPMLVPVLYIDGYTLMASDGTLGSIIQILDEDDNVVFATYVATESEIQLPTTLSGTYTIQVIRGNLTFEGEIEL